MIKNAAKQDGYTITNKELSGLSIAELQRLLDFIMCK